MKTRRWLTRIPTYSRRRCYTFAWKKKRTYQQKIISILFLCDSVLFVVLSRIWNKMQQFSGSLIWLLLLRFTFISILTTNSPVAFQTTHLVFNCSWQICRLCCDSNYFLLQKHRLDLTSISHLSVDLSECLVPPLSSGRRWFWLFLLRQWLPLPDRQWGVLDCGCKRQDI